jgi:hypothetical protein
LGTDPKENTAFDNSPIVALWGFPTSVSPSQKYEYYDNAAAVDGNL